MINPLKKEINFTSNRRFGVELEFTYPNNEELYHIIYDNTNEPVIYTGWQHSIDNNEWICKTDSTCGYEIASKVLQGIEGIYSLGKVIKVLFDNDVKYDESCGLHVHINISDFNQNQFDILCAWWIKAEHCILSMLPSHRRNNPYCLALNNNVYIINMNENGNYNMRQLRQSLFERRSTLNTRLFNNNQSESSRVEFRLAEMSLDIEYIKNWCRLLIWFVDICKVMPPPTNLKWFTPKEFVRFMGLMDDNRDVIIKSFSKTISSMRSQLISSMKHWREINVDKTNSEINELDG